jgi:hypothetical protein
MLHARSPTLRTKLMPRSSWQASLADPPVTETDLRSRYQDSSRRSRTVVTSVLVIFGLALVLGAGSLFIRWRYGTWPLAEYPSAMHYCDRTFNRLKEAPVPRLYDRDQNKEVPEPIYAAFTYHAPLVPSHAVFADTAKGDHVGDSPACASFLFIKTTANRVIIYRIVGDT